MKTILVWFRNDLRVHDHPALFTASQDAKHVVPVFIFNSALLTGARSGSNRNRFLLQSITDLQSSLRALGADLVIRTGGAAEELQKLAQETGAEAVYYSADYTAYSIARDKQVKADLEKAGIGFRSFSGRLAVSALDKLHTKTGKTHKVFTPFYNNWLQVQRREIAPLPTALRLLAGVAAGTLPTLPELTHESDLSPDVIPGGETAGRERLISFIQNDLADYKAGSNNMAADRTSRLSAYLHFGCLSPLEIESMLPDNNGAVAWRRQLAWREFYHYIIFKFPRNRTQPFQERYKDMTWDTNHEYLQAWKSGMTGYPVVDAAMRQLRREGWMHNRGRLIVGSFFTKDLWLDWRDGEAYFMQMLIDGDMANNNGNWQWIASIGVDPAPVFRRLYNPTLQQAHFDPDGTYVRKYVSELAHVPAKYLAEPWTMPEDLQHTIGCVVGKDYPAPIVDHKQARLAALERYKQASTEADNE